MKDDFFSQIEEEMERLQRRCAPWLHEVPPARQLSARWTVGGRVLLWHVTVEDVLEPDVDIEITPEGFVVRALPITSGQSPMVGLLPVPPGFDITRPFIRFESGYLEVRVSLIQTGENLR